MSSKLDYRRVLDEDLLLITELLQTCSVQFVARKWEVKYASITRYLHKHQTSAAKIKLEYRTRIINEQLAKGFKPLEIADMLECSADTIRLIIRKLK
jgi:DNA-binding NarL/FixJ family response regulator